MTSKKKLIKGFLYHIASYIELASEVFKKKNFTFICEITFNEFHNIRSIEREGEKVSEPRG